MEPSSSQANANSNNPLADGIFERLRNQLDEIQTAVNSSNPRGNSGARQQIQDTIPSSTENMGWR